MPVNAKIPKIDVGDDDFGAILNCAVRYALSRRSYMPKLVTDYIRPLLPYLTTKTLDCFIRDLESVPHLHEPCFCAPGWVSFLAVVQDEYNRRKSK